jgi:putative membrane protein insertion efficiency factor
MVKNITKVVNDLAMGAAASVIGAYRAFVSPLLPRSCRFYPTCSEYVLEALRVHGFVRGFALGAWRLARCHPFHPGGYDPVPPSGVSAVDNKESDE